MTRPLFLKYLRSASLYSWTALRCQFWEVPTNGHLRQGPGAWSIVTRMQSLFASEFARMPGPAKTIKLVSNREQWVPKQHPRPRVLHDHFGLSLLLRLVAVNGTIGARRFVVPIRAFLQPNFSVIQELTTLGTQDVIGRSVVIGTIYADHPVHGQPLTGEVFLRERHSDRYYRLRSTKNRARSMCSAVMSPPSP